MSAKQRQRVKFDTTEEVARAVRMRAGLDGVNPADVINAALEVYLAAELALVRERLRKEEEQSGGEAKKPLPRRRSERSQ